MAAPAAAVEAPVPALVLAVVDLAHLAVLGRAQGLRRRAHRVQQFLQLALLLLLLPRVHRPVRQVVAALEVLVPQVLAPPVVEAAELPDLPSRLSRQSFSAVTARSSP